MLEKHLVSLAKMTELPILWISDAVFCTASTAVNQPGAGGTVLRQKLFFLSESFLLFGLQHLNQISG
jgi:hypothetical protein